MSNWLPWALGSALFAALTTILAKVGLQGINADLATLIRTAFILVLLLLLVVVGGKWSSPALLSGRQWMFLAASAAAAAASWVCYFRALQRGPTSLVAAVDKVSVILVPILAALWLSERLGMREWAAILMIGGGVLVMVWRV